MARIEEFTQGQKETMMAFADAIKSERTGFIEAGLSALDGTIRDLVEKVLESVDTAEDDVELRDHLVEMMFEYTRRGLQRAVKGMAKGCDPDNQ